MADATAAAQAQAQLDAALTRLDAALTRLEALQEQIDAAQALATAARTTATTCKADLKNKEEALEKLSLPAHPNTWSPDRNFRKLT